ncbi:MULTISPECIES: DISARM anti-phage system protein DrmE domain-containing protein [Mammaliicoccus]|uniref:DISARM anti-phage system protein DrmE domain-containing protein n=1 Tax=Mammaliicoccus TaxID=2803850 RepID=UPI001C4F2573|nr:MULTISPECIES: hypothetical protein [Mammaliicoccus]MBW0764003.1 hypothetical protein [Mammaliicoccus fleurettii]MEB7806040.1 hypothetical protein [Mammaliicoccus fleurettii]
MGINKIKLLNNYSNQYSSIHNIKVHSKEMENLLTQFNYIKKELKLLGLDEFDEDYRSLKYIFFNLINTLKPYDEELNNKFDNEDWKNFSYFIKKLDAINENISIYVRQLVKLIKLFKSGEIQNNLKFEVDKLIDSLSESTAVILINRNEEALIRNRDDNLEFYSVNTFINNDKLYDNLVMIGSSIYFNKFDTIFMAKEIYYINFDFYKNYLRKESLIENNHFNSNIFKMVNSYKEKNKNENKLIEEHYEMEKAENIYLLEKLINQYQLNERHDLKKKIFATICGLKSGAHILLTKNNTIRSLSLSYDNENNLNLVVENKKINQLVKENWIIIKSITENIYLERKSKEIISEEKYNEYKKCIHDYKKALKLKLNELMSIEELYKDMKKHNVKISNLNTLKTWINEETIRPRNLDQILNYLNYKNEEIIKTINAADTINKLHIKVGKDLSKSLQFIISKLDSNDIYESMILYNTFSFKVEDVGEFFIEEVSFISEEQVEIDRKNLNKIFKEYKGD